MILSFFNRRGQIHNYLTVIIFLFVFGFISILSLLIMGEIVTGFAASGYYSTAAETAANGFLSALRILDYVTVLLMVILLIGVGVTSYKVAAPPVFFIVTIILGSFLGFVGYFFSYVFVTMVSDAIFTATLFWFPRTLLICSNFHWIGLACIIVGSITLFAKKPKGELVYEDSE